MKRMPYSKPFNDWEVGNRRQLQGALRDCLFKGKYPTTSSSMWALKFDRDSWRYGRRLNRLSVGLIRAFGAKHFFRGCYLGAEND